MIRFAWLISLAATVGSLFFSEILKYPPCVLCWYQRICMYPLVVILAVGLIRKDQKIYLYVLPFTVIGFLVSIYHNLLYYKLIPDALTPCIAGVSCTTKFIEWFGFVTIPFLSLVSFLLINVLMIMLIKFNKE